MWFVMKPQMHPPPSFSFFLLLLLLPLLSFSPTSRPPHPRKKPASESKLTKQKETHTRNKETTKHKYIWRRGGQKIGNAPRASCC